MNAADRSVTNPSKFSISWSEACDVTEGIAPSSTCGMDRLACPRTRNLQSKALHARRTTDMLAFEGGNSARNVALYIQNECESC